MARTRTIIALVVLGLALDAQAGSGQTFDIGPLHRDVVVEVAFQPYTIRARTSDEVLAQLDRRSPDGIWAGFPLFFEWEYDRLEEARALQGTPSNHCVVKGFRLRLKFDAIYPEWTPPPDAPAELVEAWEAFRAVVAARWEERRDLAVAFALDLSREARRMEADCPLVYPELKALVDNRTDEFDRTEQAAWENGERVSLRWPPEGFDRRLAQKAAPQRNARRPPLDAPRDEHATAPPAPAAPPPTPPPTPDRPPAPAVEVEPPPAVASDIYEALDRDFRGSTDGVVTALYYGGQPQLVHAFTKATAVSTDTLTVDDEVDFPGLTEVLVATLSAALDSAGVVNLRRPISAYLPSLDPHVGAVTLEQLLSHRAGLDNAALPDKYDDDWRTAALELPARALFTEPGAVFSYSDYDYVLAILVLEAVVRTPIADAMDQAIFAPLGMSETRLGAPLRGMPVASTSLADMQRFVEAWLSGDVRGAPRLDPDGPAGEPDAGLTFQNGLWYDRVGGKRRVSLKCTYAGLQIFPSARAALLMWTRHRWAYETARFLLTALDQGLGIGDEILHSSRVTGSGAIVDRSAPRCTEPSRDAQMVVRLAEPVPAGEWAGRYTNGDRYFELTEVGGKLFVPGETPLPIARYAGDTYFATLDGLALYPLRLIHDAAGRRYLDLADRAYLRDDDRPTRR